MITIEDIKNSSQIRTYIQKADETMCALGYTEHSFAHVTRVSETARQILLTLGYSPRKRSWLKSPAIFTTSAT